MAIVIKEIILSDTLEKFMEKVNFNFDQLLLAGGGPPGPQGPSGPIGPAGPKGDPGNKWYVGCTATEIAIGTTLYDGDLFLAKGTASGCGSSAYGPLGQVWEWDDFTNVFVDTGLNLRGPTGETGPAGANLFGGIFPGITGVGNVLRATGEALPGPTANFYLLKGDTDFPGNQYGTGPTDQIVGVTSTYSRDILWLGGLHNAQQLTDEYQLERLPKLFISPRSLFPADPYSAGVTYDGKAGSGISLGIEPTDYVLSSSANPNNWSNIFVDSLQNLRITNYTEFIPAAAEHSSGINIESLNAIKLMSGGPGPLPSIASSYNFQQGAQDSSNQFLGLDYDVIGGTPNIFDQGGHIFDQGNTTNSRFQINIGDLSVTRISGGGASLVGPIGNMPSLHLSNETGSSNIDDSDYTILLDTDSAPNDDNNWIANPQSAYIKKKASTSQDTTYIGIGVGSNLYQTHLNIVNHISDDDAKGISIGLPGTIDIPWQQAFQYSLDVVGRIRMRNSAGATGYVMTDSDGTGSGIWSDPLTIGAWVEDRTGCSSRIVVGYTDKYASTLNTDYNGYSRFDIAINDSGSGKYGDLFFNNYNNTEGYSIAIDTDDVNNQGQLSFNYFGSIESCQTSLSSRTATQLSKIMVIDRQGRIRIGDNSDSISSSLLPGYTDRLYLDSGTTSAGLQIRSNIQLRNDGSDGYRSPLLKFSFGASALGVNYQDETAFEVYRNWSGNNTGKMNIRFRGVGKANTSFESGQQGKTAIEDADGGASVLMISDREGAIARDGTPGRTNDYFELNHEDMYVDRIRLNYASVAIQRSGGATQTNHVSNLIQLYPWGTSNSGWTNPPAGNKPFKGSRAQVPFANNLAPNKFNIVLGDNADGLSVQGTIGSGANVASTGGANGLSVWHSPTTSFRYIPMNFDKPNPSNGLAYVNFNIDMGVVIDTDETSNYSGSNSDNYFTLCGPGSLSTATDNSSSSPLVGYGDLADALKIQSVRVELDGDAIKGLGPFLDQTGNENRDRTLDPYNPGADGGNGDSRKNWSTDWYPGVCKAMYDTLESNNSSTSNNQLKGGFRHPHAGADYWMETLENTAWSGPGGASVFTPFGDGAAALGDSPVGYVNNLSNPIGGIACNPDLYVRPEPKWQNAPIMWRLEREYAGNPENKTIQPKVYLHIMYLRNTVNDGLGRAPYLAVDSSSGNFIPNGATAIYGSEPSSITGITQQHKTIAQLGLPIWLDNPAKYSDPTGAIDDYYNSTANNFGIPINYFVMQEEWVDQGDKTTKQRAETMLSGWKRTASFYDSHGISFSGGGLVKWNTGSLNQTPVVGPAGPGPGGPAIP